MVYSAGGILGIGIQLVRTLYRQMCLHLEQHVNHRVETALSPLPTMGPLISYRAGFIDTYAIACIM